MCCEYWEVHEHAASLLGISSLLLSSHSKEDLFVTSYFDFIRLYFCLVPSTWYIRHNKSYVIPFAHDFHFFFCCRCSVVQLLSLLQKSTVPYHSICWHDISFTAISKYIDFYATQHTHKKSSSIFAFDFQLQSNRKTHYHYYQRFFSVFRSFFSLSPCANGSNKKRIIMDKMCDKYITKFPHSQRSNAKHFTKKTAHTIAIWLFNKSLSSMCVQPFFMCVVFYLAP